MARKKKNKKEQTFNVYPYLGGYQHFMRQGGALPKAKNGKHKVSLNKAGSIKPTNKYKYANTFDGVVNEWRAANDPNYIPQGSMLGQFAGLIDAGVDWGKNLIGAFKKENYMPGGKYSKVDETGLKYGRMKFTNTTDRDALLHGENLARYMSMSNKERKQFIEDGGRNTDLWWTDRELADGKWNYMDIDETTGLPTFDGLNYQASKLRHDKFRNPDVGTCSDPQYTNGADCEANGGVWTGESLFGIKTRNAEGDLVYFDEHGNIDNTKKTQYDIIEDGTDTGQLGDANAETMVFDFDKSGPNKLDKFTRHIDHNNDGNVTLEEEEYDPTKEYGNYESNQEIEENTQDIINCETGTTCGSPGTWITGAGCDCDGDGIPGKYGLEMKNGGALPKAQFGYFNSRDGRSNLNQSVKLAGTVGLASMLGRGAYTGLNNRKNYKNAYNDYIANQGPGWYDEMCTTGTCPSWEENRLQLLDGHDEPNFAWFRGTDDNLFGKQNVMNKNNVLQKGDLANAYWQNVKQGVKDGIYTGAINYGLNYLGDRTRFGRNVKNWWQDHNLPTVNVGYLSRYDLGGEEDGDNTAYYKHGGALPKFQGNANNPNSEVNFDDVDINAPRNDASTGRCSDPQYLTQEDCTAIDELTGNPRGQWVDETDMGVDINYGDGPIERGWNKTREFFNTGAMGAIKDTIVGGSSEEGCSDPQHLTREACEEAGEKWMQSKGTGLVSLAFEHALPMMKNIVNQNQQRKNYLHTRSVSAEDMFAASESGQGAGQRGFYDINKGGYGDDLYGTGEIFGQAQQGQEMMMQQPQRDLSGVTDFIDQDGNVSFDLELLRRQKNYLGKMNMGGQPDITKAIEAQKNPAGAVITALQDGTATNSMNAWLSGDMQGWENAGPMAYGGALPRFQGTNKSEVLDLENETRKERKNRIKNYTHPYLQQYYNEFANKGDISNEKTVRDILSSMNVMPSDTAFVNRSMDQNMVRSMGKMDATQYIGSQMYDDGTGNWSGSVSYDDKMPYYTTEQDDEGNSWDFLTNMYYNDSDTYTGVLKSRKKYGGQLPRFQTTGETSFWDKGVNFASNIYNKGKTFVDLTAKKIGTRAIAPIIGSTAAATIGVGGSGAALLDANLKFNQTLKDANPDKDPNEIDANVSSMYSGIYNTGDKGGTFYGSMKQTGGEQYAEIDEELYKELIKAGANIQIIS